MEDISTTIPVITKILENNGEAPKNNFKKGNMKIIPNPKLIIPSISLG